MAEILTYQRIVLIFQSPWNIANETEHNWSLKFNLSGTQQLNDTDAEATALSLASVPLALAQPHTSLIEYVYYGQNHSVADAYKTYAAGTHQGTASAYSSSTSSATQQLEVCAVARCAVGKNARGKTVYLRKFMHDVQCGATPNTLGSLLNAAALLAPWETGAGPHNLVPVRPMTGDQGTGWSIESHLYTRQLRRGAKRKKAATGSAVDQIFKLIGQGAAAKTILEDALSALG